MLARLLKKIKPKKLASRFILILILPLILLQIVSAIIFTERSESAIERSVERTIQTIEKQNGTEITIPQKDLANIYHHDRKYIFIVWSVGFGLIFILIAWGYMRKQVSHLIQIRDIAQNLAHGKLNNEINTSGAHEIRDAKIALIEAEQRLKKIIEANEN